MGAEGRHRRAGTQSSGAGNGDEQIERSESRFAVQTFGVHAQVRGFVGRSMAVTRDVLSSPARRMRTPELQAKIDAVYDEWRKSRAKWNTPRGRWHDVILKLRMLDNYRYRPSAPLSEKELVTLRAVLRTALPTRMWHWSVRREGDSVVIARGERWWSALNW